MFAMGFRDLVAQHGSHRSLRVTNLAIDANPLPRNQSRLGEAYEFIVEVLVNLVVLVFAAVG